MLSSVVLISSEFGYPFRLEAAGLDLRDIGRVIVTGEVRESDMLKMLKDDWDMDKGLAEMFYNYFGGDIFTTKKALDSLIEKKENFDPFAVRCPRLASCTENAAARAHLENIAKQEFLVNVKTDEGAKMIAEENLGKASTRMPSPWVYPLSSLAQTTSYHYVKLLTAHELQNIPLPAGPCAAAPWAQELRRCD
eukprot:Skav211733  [mRNA]  locus=scaffold1682:78941:80304:+ [translate_table: standard]